MVFRQDRPTTCCAARGSRQRSDLEVSGNRIQSIEIYREKLALKHRNTHHQQQLQIETQAHSTQSLLPKLPLLQIETWHKTFFPNVLDSVLKMMTKGAMAVAILAALTVASPAPRSRIVKRYTDGEDCTSDTVADRDKSGLLFAIDSDGVNIPCDEIDENVSADKWVIFPLKTACDALSLSSSLLSHISIIFFTIHKLRGCHDGLTNNY